MIALAVDTAEDLMRTGNAPAQIVTHYLKLGSSRERLEKQRIAMEVELMEAKKEQMASMAKQEELFEKAIRAMKTYSGSGSHEDEDYED